MFAGTKRALPLLTQIMLGVSELVRHWGWLIGLMLVLLGGLARYLLTIEAWRLRFDAAWLGLPLVGKLSRGYNAARFASTLAMLAAAGVAAHPSYPLDGVSLLPVLQGDGGEFERPMFWRMNHRGQRAARLGDWKYLRVDGHDYLFNIPADERERANHASRQPERLAELRAAWEAWEATMPPIPEDATVSLGYGAKDMPQR